MRFVRYRCTEKNARLLVKHSKITEMFTVHRQRTDSQKTNFMIYLEPEMSLNGLIQNQK